MSTHAHELAVDDLGVFARLATLLLVAGLASGCVVARASAIRSMRVMPSPALSVESERRCVAWANTGACQIWIQESEDTP